MERYLYLPSRPVTYAELGNVRWRYIEAPPKLADNMAGCPVSKHEFGVIATDKYLLQSVIDRAGLTPYPEAVKETPEQREPETLTETEIHSELVSINRNIPQE